MTAEVAKIETVLVVKPKPVFLSHATKDKPLAEKFAILLTNGCDISPNEILCTSLPGKGIPGGTPSFIEYLKSQLEQPKLVILLLSENYFVSQFCLCELGATWRMGLPFFPLVVPPLAKSELGGVLEVAQAGSITDGRYLDQLREAVIKYLGRQVPTDAWNVQAGVFLDGLDGLITGLEKPPMIQRTELDKEHAQYKVAISEIANKTKHETELKAQIADLEKCKNRDDVLAVNSKYSSDQEQFNRLVSVAKADLGRLCNVTAKAIFFEKRGDRYVWNGENEWNNVREAEQIKEVEIVEDHIRYCKPREEHPRVSKATDSLIHISEFLAEGRHYDFLVKLEEEHGFPIELNNKEFWQSILGIYF